VVARRERDRLHGGRRRRGPRAGLPAAAVIAFAAAVGAVVGAFAEVQTTASVSVSAAMMHVGDSASFSTTEAGRVTFQAASSRDVKALLEADVSLTPGGSPDFSLSLPRAYVKVRFPWFRLTAGKTRLSWGSGFLFDAGDAIFGHLPPLADLSAADLRDRTAWLVSPYVALGDFSFVEGVFLPFMPALPSPLPAAAPPLVSFDSVSAGARAVLGMPGFTLEAGYLHDGERDLHKPFLSLQASLYFELYGAAGISIPDEAASWDDMKDSVRLSCGLFRAFDLEDWGSLSIRAEAGFIPMGAWEEADGGLPSDSPGYGASAFLEVAYSPEDTVSLSARGILSPVDASGVGMLGVSWVIYQGLTLSGNAFLMFGDADDVYGWERNGDSGVIAGIRYSF
jgi:hypothetical protein